MNVSLNMNTNMQPETGWNVATGSAKEQPGAQEKMKSFSMAQKAQDPIAERKAQAFEKARKIVSDAFAGEQKIDAQLEELRDLSARLTEDNKEKLDQISQNKTEMDELQQVYGVTEDSQQQKDLELLMKKHDSYYDPTVRLSEQEQARYEEIMAAGPTEYQSRMMERHEENRRLEREMQENLAAIQANGAAVRFVKGERLKNSPILDAEQAADKVLDAESEAITGELVGDAVEHMQDELSEKVEEAEKLAQQREEQKEQIREEVKETQTVSGNASPEDIVQIQQQIQAEIEKVLEELKLMAEDLKGNAIDKLV